MGITKIMLIFLSILCITGCTPICKNCKKKKSNVVNKAKVKNKKEYMKIAFAYPVIAVNNVKAKKEDLKYQQSVQTAFAQNSTNNIVLTVVDSTGKTHKIYGILKVFKYTKYSKPGDGSGDVILVAPDSPEYTYSSIISNGYGEITVREHVESFDLDESPTPVLLKLILGSKKKDKNTVKLSFRENSFYSIEGKNLPASFIYKKNSVNNLKLTLDDGTLKLDGKLKVFKGNLYTSIAPVWVNLNEHNKDYLRSRGGKVTLAIYIPSSESKQNFVDIIEENENPLLLAKKRGSLVALLEIKRRPQ